MMMMGEKAVLAKAKSSLCDGQPPISLAFTTLVVANERTHIAVSPLLIINTPLLSPSRRNSIPAMPSSSASCVTADRAVAPQRGDEGTRGPPKRGLAGYLLGRWEIWPEESNDVKEGGEDEGAGRGGAVSTRREELAIGF
jgi:hypothetical protein